MNKDIEINNKFYQKTIHGGKCDWPNLDNTNLSLIHI